MNTGRWLARRVGLAGAAVLLALVSAPAAGASTEGPTLSGSVSGGLSLGAKLTIRIDAAEAGGWQGLHLLDAALLVGGQAVETLSYGVEDQWLAVGNQEVFAGTGGVVAGSYLQVGGADVVVTTGGANISLAATATVLRAIPGDARFRLQATDDAGRTASVTRSIGTERGAGGLSWGSVLATVAVALLAGGFLGNLFASRRRPPPRLSVYSTIQRRIDEGRPAEKPAS